MLGVSKLFSISCHLGAEIRFKIIRPHWGRPRADHVRFIMEATWTPAEDAGSMRFSQNLRDRSTYAQASWARRDRPLWMPEVLADILLERLDLSMGAVYLFLAVVLAIIALCVRETRVYLRAWRSDTVMVQIVRQEKAEKAQAAAAAAAAKAIASAPDAPGSSGPLVRCCRFCDVPIADEFVDAHAAGKKHKRLVSVAGSAGADCCWVWRSAHTLEAPEAERRDDAAASDMPVASMARKGGGDGGKGSWSVAKSRKKQ